MSNASGDARAKGWFCHDKGYWSHPEHGHIIKNWNGWQARPAKPFQTMTEAMELCETVGEEASDV